MQFGAPDNGRKPRLKNVEHLTEINKLRNVASCWLYSANILAMHRPMNVKLCVITTSVAVLMSSQRALAQMPQTRYAVNHSDPVLGGVRCNCSCTRLKDKKTRRKIKQTGPPLVDLL